MYGVIHCYNEILQKLLLYKGKQPTIFQVNASRITNYIWWELKWSVETPPHGIHSVLRWPLKSVQSIFTTLWWPLFTNKLFIILSHLFPFIFSITCRQYMPWEEFGVHHSSSHQNLILNSRSDYLEIMITKSGKY